MSIKSYIPAAVISSIVLLAIANIGSAPATTTTKVPTLERGTKEYMARMEDIFTTDLAVAAENSFECPKKSYTQCNFDLAISHFDNIIAKRKNLYVPPCLNALDGKVSLTLGALYAGVKFVRDGAHGDNERLKMGLASVMVGKDYMRETNKMVAEKIGNQSAVVAGCVVK
jgi:hypothetical protein